MIVFSDRSAICNHRTSFNICTHRILNLDLGCTCVVERQYRARRNHAIIDLILLKSLVHLWCEHGTSRVLKQVADLPFPFETYFSHLATWQMTIVNQTSSSRVNGCVLKKKTNKDRLPYKTHSHGTPPKLIHLLHHFNVVIVQVRVITVQFNWLLD